MEADRLTPEEAAFVLKVGVPTIESLIHRGALRAEEREGSYTILREDLLELLRRDQREIEASDESDWAQDFGLMGKRIDE